MLRHLRDWWRREGALVRLCGLDDRLLADMGLVRAGLRARVTEKPKADGPEMAACRLAPTSCDCRAE